MTSATRLKILAAIATVASIPQARAHHGQDFLLNYDPDAPGGGSSVVSGSFEWSREEDGSEVSFEPSFLTGIAPNLSAGASLRLEDQGGGDWAYAGINPMLQYLLPVPGDTWKVAIYAGYLFADPGEHQHVHVHDGNPGGIDQGPDAPPASGPSVHVHEEGHTHEGIHRHDSDNLQLRLLVEAKAGENGKVIANLIGVAGSRDDIAFGYSAGYRQQLSHAWAAGLEAIGDFDTQGQHEIAAGVYWTPIHSCTLRLGLGTGLGPGAPDFSVHSGVTWRF